MLSEPSVKRAIATLHVCGDTDMFPPLQELKFFAQAEDVVADKITRLNVGQYNPTSAVEVLTPKSAFGFRIGHQLTATDALIYTASVIESAPQLEAMRERVSGEGAFSYRFDAQGASGPTPSTAREIIGLHI